MTITPRTHRLILALAVSLVAALGAAALSPPPGQAAGRTVTIKAYSKIVSITLTRPDGTVVTQGEPQPGDMLDLYAVDFRGNHKRHAKRFFASEHLQCVFGTGEPDCISHLAIGRSLLVWSGNPATLIAGTGRFQGATGRVLVNKEVPGGSDIVAKIKLAKRP